MTLLQTDFLANKPEQFSALRYLMQDGGLQSGVVRAADFQVVQRASSANLSVDVGAGSGWIIGAATARQGIYHQVNDATVNVPIALSPDGTNPRSDQLILVVNDSAVAGVSDTPQLLWVAGTATAGAQITAPLTTATYRLGAVSDATLTTTYRNWIRLADILVPASAASIVTANIVDRRPWARGALISVPVPSTVFNSNASTLFRTAGTLGVAGFPFSLECSGAPLLIAFSGNIVSGGAGGGFRVPYSVTFDGAAFNYRYVQTPTNNISVNGSYSLLSTPSAGRHLFDVGTDNAGIGTSGTAVEAASIVSVTEMPRAFLSAGQ
jgi:hypothetical protein